MAEKLLLIGLGRWGQIHLKTWRQLGVEPLVCDASPAALEQARAQGLVAAADFRELLPRADIVDVVTPAPTHRAVVRACLEAGKDVHCEKPLTLASEEGYELADLAHARGRILQVGHVFRFEPCAEAARGLVREGRIGRIRYLTAHFMGFKRPRQDGGVAVSDAIHMIDLACWLMEKTPRKVQALLRDNLGRGMDDAAFILLDFGAEVAKIEASYFPPERRRDLTIMGTEGAIACDLLAAKDKVRVFSNRHRQKGADWVADEGEVASIPVPDGEPLRRELADFLRCVRERAQPLVDGTAGAHAVAVIEAAEKSAREERAVPVEIRQPMYAG